MQTERAMTLTLNGRTYQVTVGDLTASPVPVTVNGRTYHVTLDDATGAPAAVQEAPKEKEKPAAPPPAPAPGPKNGGGPHQPNGDGVAYVRAPMPGHISNVAVQAGQQVDSGDTLCALEAMKMKNPIRAPRSGVLTAVDVRDGQAVAHGDVLFALE